MPKFTQFNRRDFAELEITDGTTTVDFIDPLIGFHLDSWRPVESGIKGGGVWYDNPLADGRRPAFARYENAVETFELKIGEKCTDDVYDRQISKLRQLQISAREFFTRKWRTYVDNLPNKPVYIRARGIHETNMRYCIVYSGSVPEEEDPYSPQMVKALADNITFVFERGHWQDTIPEQTNNLPISGMSEYDGIALGNVFPVIPPELDSFRAPTSESFKVLVSNKQQVHNLTHVFTFETGVGWGVNLADDQPPIQMFQAAGTQVGDIMVFGIEDDPAQFTDGPFSSLAFFIHQVSDVEVDVEYYDGGGWVALDYQGFNFNGDFSGLGLSTISWRMPSDWAQFDPAATGDTGWYIRLIVTDAGTGVGPIQDTYRFYTIAWAHTHINQGAIDGDLPALLQIKLHNISDNSGIDLIPDPSTHANRVIIGLRSLARGEDFTPYLDAGGYQNDDQDVTITYYNTTTRIASTMGYGNSIALYDPTGAAGMLRQVQWKIGTSTVYYGAYRIFARVRQLGGSVGQGLVQLVASFGTMPVYTSDPVVVPSIGGNNLIDFGSCSLSPDPIVGWAVGGLAPGTNIYFDLYAEALADIDIEFYDLVLIPIDEWSGDFVDTVGTTVLSALGDTSEGGTKLYIDSAVWQHGTVRALLQGAATDTIDSVWQSVANGPVIAQVNKDSVTGQRLWFLFAKRHDVNFEEDDWRSNHEHSNIIEVEFVQRYLGSRGSR